MLRRPRPLEPAPPQAAPPAAPEGGPLKVPAYQADAQAEAAAVGQALSTMPRQLMTQRPGTGSYGALPGCYGQAQTDP